MIAVEGEFGIAIVVVGVVDDACTVPIAGVAMPQGACDGGGVMLISATANGVPAIEAMPPATISNTPTIKSGPESPPAPPLCRAFFRALPCLHPPVG